MAVVEGDGSSAAFTGKTPQVAREKLGRAREERGKREKSNLKNREILSC
jgi:hypothetical protein